jgi:hypothetical protein
MPVSSHEPQRSVLSRRPDRSRRSRGQQGGVRAIDEIRVKAEPDWYANPVELTFNFIRSQENAESRGNAGLRGWTSG